MENVEALVVEILEKINSFGVVIQSYESPVCALFQATFPIIQK